MCEGSVVSMQSGDEYKRLATIEEAIADIGAGKMIILVDDEDRENEGDLVVAADQVSAQDIAFMAREGRGLICLALGAEEGDVLRMVMGEGARLVLGALVLGGVASMMLSGLLSGLLFEIQPTDPVTFVAVAVVLSGVALLAAFVPARRATRVDPIDALKAE